MSFILFFVYLTICLIIYGILGVLIYKFFVKKKCFDVSKFTEQEIDNYFKAFDNSFNESEKKENDKKIYSSF